MKERISYWEHFHHGADIGIRGVGRTRDEAFEQAAMALTAVMTAPERVAAQVEVAIVAALAEATDDLLLYDWLNAVIFQAAVRGLIFGRYRVETRPTGVWGWAWGEVIDEERHDLAVEIKGATMTCLKAGLQADGSYLAQCVVDV